MGRGDDSNSDMAAADDEDYFVDDEDAIKFITFPDEVEKAIEQVGIV